MIEISRALVSRGHGVEFLANEYFEEKARRSGLEFHAIGDKQLFQKSLDDPRLWHPYKAFPAVWEMLNENLPMAYREVLSRIEANDGNVVLVGTTLAIACRLLQEIRGLPYVTVHLSPGCLISRYDPPSNAKFEFPSWMPQWSKALYVDLLESTYLDRVCKGDVNKFRAEYGLPPTDHIFTRWLHSTDKVIYAFPQWFASQFPDWPENGVFTGFPLFMKREGESLSEKTLAFIKRSLEQKGTAPVVFTAGSAMAHSRQYFAKALDAVRGTDVDAIFVSKFPDQLPADLPSSVLHTPFEPFDLLFEQASVVCHHGGIGTSAQGLRAGKPQLITPFAHDQFDNAMRLKRLGVAGAASVDDRLSVWVEALRLLLHDPEIQAACSRMRGMMLEGDCAADRIADEVVLLANDRCRRSSSQKKGA